MSLIPPSPGPSRHALPHPQSLPSPHSPVALHPVRTSPKQIRQSTLSSPRNRSGTLPYGSSGGSSSQYSRSAPTSPAGRVLPAGLTPLSTISDIHLGKFAGDSLPRPMAPQRGGSVDTAGVNLQGYVEPQQQRQLYQLPGPVLANTSNITSQQSSASTSTLPPLLNPAARMRLGGRPATGASSNSSSISDTETEGADSDSTYVPGKTGVRHKHSLSQPDLTALRSRLEGWAGGVAKGQAEEKRAREARRKTPPTVSRALASSSASVQPHNIHPKSKSHASLVGLRGSPSPKQSPALLSPLTPILSSSSDGSSPRVFERAFGAVGESEDADDDYDGTTDSPSSGSLSFSPKRRVLRQRMSSERAKGSLGLSFGPDTTPVKREDPLPVLIERRLQQSSLLSLRLLAIVPSLWGIAVLFEALISADLSVDVWPWGVDLSREALERLVAGGQASEGVSRKVSRGDMVLAIAWAVITAQFCFHLTTGLAHRWRSYYSLPSTLTRLLSLQCLCWPATYLTLWFLGAQRPLLAWIVIGVTTGWSRTVQMWVTSNVIPADNAETTPRAKLPPLPPHEMGWWDRFTWGRTWDWDAIAREVGWRVGALFLITTAWLFWRIDQGTLVEIL